MKNGQATYDMLRGISSTKRALTVPMQCHPLTKTVKSTGAASQIRKEVFDSFRRSNMIDSSKTTKVATPRLATSSSGSESDSTEDESEKEVLKTALTGFFNGGFMSILIALYNTHFIRQQNLLPK